MKTRVLLMVAAAGLSGGALAAETAWAAPPVLGQVGKAKAKKKQGKQPAGPTEVEKKVKLSPKGLRFGMGVKDLAKLYAQVFEKEYRALYQKVQPGPRMAELDAELAEKKALIERNKMTFGSLPSGLERTPLAQEFTHNNDESMTKVVLRDGSRRHFFFFGDRLWKVYDVHKLGKKSKLGASFDAAVSKLEERLGKPPRRLEPGEGRLVPSADWHDGKTIIRVLDLGGRQAALLYIDRSVEENLDRYRRNKGDDGKQLDSDVARATAAPDKKK